MDILLVTLLHIVHGIVAHQQLYHVLTIPPVGSGVVAVSLYSHLTPTLSSAAATLAPDRASLTFYSAYFRVPMLIVAYTLMYINHNSSLLRSTNIMDALPNRQQNSSTPRSGSGLSAPTLKRSRVVVSQSKRGCVTCKHGSPSPCHVGRHVD